MKDNCFDCMQIYLRYPVLYTALKYKDVMLCERCIGEKVMRLSREASLRPRSLAA